MNKKIIFLLPLVLLWSSSLFGQLNDFGWHVGIKLGGMNYYGDLSQSLISNQADFVAYDPEAASWGAGIFLENRLSPTWGARLDANYGYMTANDRAIDWSGNLIQSERTAQALNFRTRIADANLSLMFHLNNDWLLPQKSRIAPYLFAGIGVADFSVSGDLYRGGTRYHYWQDGTIRTLAETSERPQDAVIIRQDRTFETNLTNLKTESDAGYATQILQIPFGAGLQFRLSDRLNFGLQSQIHYAFSDYLDDVSRTYRSSFESTLQEYASNPGHVDLAAYPTRGNPNGQNDWYAFTSLSLSINLGMRLRKFKAPSFYSSPASSPAVEEMTVDVVAKEEIGENMREEIVDTQPAIPQEVIESKIPVEEKSEVIAATHETTLSPLLPPEPTIPTSPELLAKLQAKIDSLEAQTADTASVQAPSPSPKVEPTLEQKPEELATVQVEIPATEEKPVDTVAVQAPMSIDQQQIYEAEIAALKRKLNQQNEESKAKEVAVNDSLERARQSVPSERNASQTAADIADLQAQIDQLKAEAQQRAMEAEVQRLQQELQAKEVELEASQNALAAEQTKAYEKEISSLSQAADQQRIRAEEQQRQLAEAAAANQVLQQKEKALAAQLLVAPTVIVKRDTLIQKDTIIQEVAPILLDSVAAPTIAIDSLQGIVDSLIAEADSSVQVIPVPLAIVDSLSENDGMTISEILPVDPPVDVLPKKDIEEQKDEATTAPEIIPELVIQEAPKIIVEQKVENINLLGSRFAKVFFASGVISLSPDAKANLVDLVESLQQYPSLHVRLKGFADKTGNPVKNLELSKKRAAAVQNFLVGEGIGENRISIQSFGDAQSSSSNGIYDRRVDLELWLPTSEADSQN